LRTDLGHKNLASTAPPIRDLTPSKNYASVADEKFHRSALLDFGVLRRSKSPAVNRSSQKQNKLSASAAAATVYISRLFVAYHRAIITL